MRIGQKQWLRRRARGASALVVLSLFVAAGCSEEVGGDGFVPDRPSAGKAGGGSGGLANIPSGGMMDAVGGEADTSTAGSGGKSRGGSAGKSSGGKAGTDPTQGGAAGGTSVSTCGNGTIEAGEQCDDGNTKSGDGCTADCLSACEVCEKTFCKAVHSHEAGEFDWGSDAKKNPYDPFTNCYEMPNLATSGPAAGAARAELCRAAVDCARRERCAQLVQDNPPPPATSESSLYDFLHCYCSYDVTATGWSTQCSNHENFASDPAHMPNYRGKCYREFQEASEYDTEREASGSYYNPAKPFGAANTLLSLCDRALCTEECLPQASVGIVAQISADILAAKNDAGESALGDMIADAERAAGGTDFAFVEDLAYASDYAARGLIFHATPGRAADAEGRVLESEIRHVLIGMLPSLGGSLNVAAGRLLVTLQLTGQQIYDFLAPGIPGVDTSPAPFSQVSGMTYTWSATTHTLTKVMKDGNPIDKQATYTVTLSDKLLHDESHRRLAAATNVVTTDKAPEPEFVKYLKGLTQPIAPPQLNRITVEK